MESLPKGLVTTSARVPSYLEDPSQVDAGDIAHLWKGISLSLFLSLTSHSLIILLSSLSNNFLASLPLQPLHPPP